MKHIEALRLFCIINQKSGSHNLDFITLVEEHFRDTPHIVKLYPLPEHCQLEDLKALISGFSPDRVIAVGGDGTIRLAAQCLLSSDTPLAIVPAGSANGMALEIGLKNNLDEALKTAIAGRPRSIHTLMINGELSIHLADTGLNAGIVKKFQSINERGMFGYAKALWRALKKHKRMHIAITVDGKLKQQKAEMVVIANGTTYGTGVKINKTGSLFDNAYEIVIVKWFSLLELLKMCLNMKTAFNSFKTEIIRTDQKIYIDIKEDTYFQIDGEYIGKVNRIEADIIPNALWLVVP